MNTSSPDLPTAPVIVWFRNDLRLHDNLALTAAANSGQPVIPVYILEEADDTLPLGGAQRWWLHHSLASLADKLKTLDVPLVMRRGAASDILLDLIEETGACSVLWNRRYAPAQIERDSAIKEELRARDLTVESFDGQLLHEPTRLKTGSGGAYRVYTPFWKALSQSIAPRAPAPAPKKIKACDQSIASDNLSDWDLLPGKPNWAKAFGEEWTPGEDGAHDRLDQFLSEALADYGEGRDFPAKSLTSRLSPHLAFGEISPFQIWHAMEPHCDEVPSRDFTTFRKELVWREFCWHLLVAFPDLGTENFNGDFDAFPWRDSSEDLTRWQQGMTGYPIVDAGMRQLWQTGWMHNRVRMIVGSFLVKHLLIHWRHGEAWFRDTLVDADPASNTANWQWIAGSGADAAPYFRIFNPILQGEKFDADGSYVRRFVPELADMPDSHIHKPWEASKSALDRAGVKLGDTYPRPMVEHQGARDRAMAAYKEMKGKAA
ncbi:cryptochrome/photolyase family protein [Oricola indica]|jgi:deoxyribodipyrimidine photo-lyase|uniref:cryptochrome/photolyase family protein n=1 Tax=Oricola indica TaxID=2872591 RepID=UPI001CBEE0AD|nr:deoxyribodipyrimidine photo-lyase [Oricola indica]